MSVIRAHPTPRGAGHLLRAAVAAWLLVLALVAPVGAVEGPTRLFDPSVSPTTATPTTTITLSVEYRNREGSAPAYVRVVIDGTAHDMTGDGGDDWKKGVGHHYATKLAAGTHQVSFVAADTRKFSDEVDGGSITVTVPAPPAAANARPDPGSHAEARAEHGARSRPDPGAERERRRPGGTGAGGGGSGGSDGTGETGTARGSGGTTTTAAASTRDRGTSTGRRHWRPDPRPEDSAQTWGGGLDRVGSGATRRRGWRRRDPTRGHVAAAGAGALAGAGAARGPTGRSGREQQPDQDRRCEAPGGRRGTGGSWRLRRRLGRARGRPGRARRRHWPHDADRASDARRHDRRRRDGDGVRDLRQEAPRRGAAGAGRGAAGPCRSR